MKLLRQKHRNDQRREALRIAISQDEITADLRYPAVSRRAEATTAERPRGV